MSERSAVPLEFIAQMRGGSETANQIRSLGGAFQSFGTDADKAAVSAGKVDEANKKLDVSTKQATLAFATAASSIVNMAFQFDNLEKKATVVEQRQLTLSKAEEELSAAQNKLNELTAQGITAGDQYQAAQTNLEQAQAKVQISTDKLSQAQGDMTEAQLHFALSVVPTVISTISTLQIGIQGLSAAKIASTVATIQEGAAHVGSIPGKIAHAAATAGVTLATNAMTVAMRIAQIAMGPVGWILLGIGGFMTAVATNAFGLRDAIEGFAKAAYDAVPFLRPLFDAISNLASMIFPKAEAQTEQLSTTTQTETGAMQDSWNQMLQGIEVSNEGILASTANLENQSAGHLQGFVDNMDKTARDAEKAAKRIEKALEKASVKDTTTLFNTAGMGTQSQMPGPSQVSLTPEQQTAVSQFNAQAKLLDDQIKALETKLSKLSGGVSTATLQKWVTEGRVGGDIIGVMSELSKLREERTKLVAPNVPTQFGSYSTTDLAAYAAANKPKPSPTWQQMMDQAAYNAAFGQGGGQVTMPAPGGPTPDSFAAMASYQSQPVSTLSTSHVVIPAASNPWTVINVQIDGQTIATAVAKAEAAKTS